MKEVQSKQSAPVVIPYAEQGPVTRWLLRLVLLGVAWLILGMAVMPAGVSYNPGKIYQHVLVLTLFLPALVLLVVRPARSMDFWRHPLVPWVLLLLAWGLLSLAWGHAARKEDEAGHNVSILLFLFAWQQALGRDEALVRRLFLGCGLVMAVVAMVAMVESVLYPQPDARLSGFGVMANANLAAGGMGAALLWLWPWRFEERRWCIAKWLAISVLALFVLMTLTRSALAALFMALVAVVLCRGGRRAWIYAGLLVALGVVSALVGAQILMARGWSLRPEIFAQSVHLFLEHPWRGLGEGTPFQFTAGGEVLTHAHNMYSQLAIELGVPGLLLWTGIWLAVGWMGWRHRREPLGMIVVGLWVFGTVLVQFDLPHLIDSPRPAWLITWLPLALAMSLDRRTDGSGANVA
jgi:O-antigen ligase